MQVWVNAVACLRVHVCIGKYMNTCKCIGIEILFVAIFELRIPTSKGR